MLVLKEGFNSDDTNVHNESDGDNNWLSCFADVDWSSCGCDDRCGCDD